MKRLRRITVLFVAGLFMLIFAPQALATAANVSVMVNGYDGRWRVDGTNYIDDQVIPLEPGTHNFNLINVNNNYFQFTVDGSGNVTVSNPDLATGGARTLTLITHPLYVNVSGYEGRWRSGADVGIFATRYRENKPIYLPAATYNFSLTLVAQNYFAYVVDTAGNVTVFDTDLASGGAGMLMLITHPVYVGVSNYEGRWRSGADVGIFPTRYRENELIYLPATTYNFSLTLVVQNYFQYVVDTAGNVTVFDADLATGGAGTLTLITHPVDVDVSNYEGRWRSGADVGIFPTRYRENQLIFLPATSYQFSLTNVASDYFQYAVDTAGNVSVSNTDLATGGAGTLTLITHVVDVDVSNYPGRWRSGADNVSVTRYQGNKTVYLPAATYQVNLVNVVVDYVQYTVDIAGNVTVSDSYKAVGGANSLTLISRAVDFNLGGAPGPWRFGDSTPVLTGDQTLCLAPAVYTFIMAGNLFDYVVDNGVAPYYFTVSPNSSVISVDGVNYTVNLSLGSLEGNCFPIPQTAWDDLYGAINEAQIDLEGIRTSLLAMVDAAKAAYESGNPVTTGNILCALLSEVDAQEGVHIEPASADDIRNTAVNVAAALGIPLACLSS